MTFHFYTSCIAMAALQAGLASLSPEYSDCTHIAVQLQWTGESISGLTTLWLLVAPLPYPHTPYYYLAQRS